MAILCIIVTNLAYILPIACLPLLSPAHQCLPLLSIAQQSWLYSHKKILRMFLAWNRSRVTKWFLWFTYTHFWIIFPVEMFSISCWYFAYNISQNVLKSIQPIIWIVTEDVWPQNRNEQAFLIEWGGCWMVLLITLIIKLLTISVAKVLLRAEYLQGSCLPLAHTSQLKHHIMWHVATGVMFATVTPANWSTILCGM